MIKIDQWSIHPDLYGVTRISGKVYGYPGGRHHDGKSITTSPVIAVDEKEKTFKTYTGKDYILGEPEETEVFDSYSKTEKPVLEVLVTRIHNFLDGQQYLKRLKAEEKVIKMKDIDYPIFRDDVLVKSNKGGYTKLTGICMCELPITDDEVENWDRVVCLEMM
jgi:hypothetical protein